MELDLFKIVGELLVETVLPDELNQRLEGRRATALRRVGLWRHQLSDCFPVAEDDKGLSRVSAGQQIRELLSGFNS